MWNPKKTKGLLSGNDFKVTPPSSDFSIQGGDQQANQTSLGVNYIPSSKLLLSARYGYNYLNAKGNTYGKDDAPDHTYQTASSHNGLVVPAQFAGAAGFANVSNPFSHAVRPPDAPQRLSRRDLLRDDPRAEPHPQGWIHAQPPLADDVQSNYPQGPFEVFWNEDFDRAAPYSTSAAPTGTTSGRTAFD